MAQLAAPALTARLQAQRLLAGGGRADHHGMGRIGVLAVAMLLLLVARCSTADFAGALEDVPVVGAMIQPPPTPAKYVSSIGTPAASPLPETDLATWFVAGAKDPYDPTTWQAIDRFLATARTKDGWTAACKKAGEAAGADRAAKPELGALACSKDGAVTGIQRFAVRVLQARAATALYVKGAPGSAIAAIQAYQGEVRLACAVDTVARQGGPESTFGKACARALDTSYLAGNPQATFTALGEAYTLAASEIAKLAPTVDAEPGWFEPVKK